MKRVKLDIEELLSSLGAEKDEIGGEAEVDTTKVQSLPARPSETPCECDSDVLNDLKARGHPFEHERFCPLFKEAKR